MTGAACTSDLVEVRLLDLPLDLWSQAQEHADELLREFTLLTAGIAEGGDTHTPRRLLEVVAELQAEYEQFSADQDVDLRQAAESGIRTIDLTYVVPRQAAEACVRLGEALDAADRYCRAGDHLLTLATPAPAVAFRRWYLGEFVRQIAGGRPTPWGLFPTEGAT